MASKSRESITRVKPRRDRGRAGAREEGREVGREGRKEGRKAKGGPASSKKIFEYDYIPRVNRIVRKRAACYTRNAFAGCRRWGARAPPHRDRGNSRAHAERGTASDGHSREWAMGPFEQFCSENLNFEVRYYDIITRFAREQFI